MTLPYNSSPNQIGKTFLYGKDHAMENQQKIKAQSKSQLANAYEVGIKTFNSWIKPFEKEIGEFRGKSYTPRQVSIIFEKLGEP